MSTTHPKKRRHAGKKTPTPDVEEASATVLAPAKTLTATAALARITPRALALAPAEVLTPYRVVPAVAMVNVRIACQNLAPFRSRMAAALPLLDLGRFDALEDTALALVAAAANADKVANDGEVLRQLEAARGYRSRLLAVLRGLALNGQVPMKAYRDIAAGSGIRDVAQDCIDLPAAFRRHRQAIEGKHPISDADLAATDAVGTWLLKNLGTKGARPAKGTPNAAIDLRNRIATLLVRDHEVASVIGFYFFRDRYLAAVPPLGSRLVARRPPSPAEAAAPAPAPTSS